MYLQDFKRSFGPSGAAESRNASSRINKPIDTKLAKNSDSNAKSPSGIRIIGDDDDDSDEDENILGRDVVDDDDDGENQNLR